MFTYKNEDFAWNGCFCVDIFKLKYTDIPDSEQLHFGLLVHSILN